ncbi:MAG: ACT domain-containing protein [Neisseria sp.]|nr:ACT domain-containing protein [Neisseria sp.]
MSNSVITVIGKDRVGIVYDVSKILAENQLNILNISQQLMDDFFTMIILVDTEKCPKSRQEMLDLFAAEGQKLALDIRMQNEDIFNAMHRI